MSISTEPNPPVRRDEDFPKTNTLPDGWTLDAIMEVYNRPGSAYDPAALAAAPADAQPAPVPATGADGCAQPSAAAADGAAASRKNENLFTRRLEPFPVNTNAVGMWL